MAARDGKKAILKDIHRRHWGGALSISLRGGLDVVRRWQKRNAGLRKSGANFSGGWIWRLRRAKRRDSLAELADRASATPVGQPPPRWMAMLP